VASATALAACHVAAAAAAAASDRIR